MDGDATIGEGCGRCLTLLAVVAQRDATIRELSATLERVTARLQWEGLDDDALKNGAAYLAYRRAHAHKSAWPGYRARLLPFVWRYRHLPVLQSTPERWAEHMTARRRAKVGRWKDHAVKTSTLDQELMITRMMYRWLVIAGKLPRNPLEGAELSGEPSGRETWLPEADVLRLLAGASMLAVDGRGHRDERRVLLFRAFYETKFRTGWRFETVRRLRRDAIRPDGTVEVSRKRTKSKRRHTTAIPLPALEAIAALPPLDNDPHVFTHRRAGKVRVFGGSQLRKWFDRVCAATGIHSLAADGDGRVKPHDLRHSAASHLDAQGAHALDIRDFLDHSTLGTSERYLHRRQAERALAMADLMGGRKPAQRAVSKTTQAEHESG